MVRTAILSVAAACTLFALIGCNNRAEVDALQPAQAAELKTHAAKLARRAALCGL